MNLNNNINNTNIPKIDKSYQNSIQLKNYKRNEDSKTVEWINEFYDNLDTYLNAIDIPSTQPIKYKEDDYNHSKKENIDTYYENNDISNMDYNYKIDNTNRD